MSSRRRGGWGDLHSLATVRAAGWGTLQMLREKPGWTLTSKVHSWAKLELFTRKPVCLMFIKITPCDIGHSFLTPSFPIAMSVYVSKLVSSLMLSHYLKKLKVHSNHSRYQRTWIIIQRVISENGKPEFLPTCITYIHEKHVKPHLMSFCLFFSEACFEMFPSTFFVTKTEMITKIQ